MIEALRISRVTSSDKIEDYSDDVIKWSSSPVPKHESITHTKHFPLKHKSINLLGMSLTKALN